MIYLDKFAILVFKEGYIKLENFNDINITYSHKGFDININTKFYYYSFNALDLYDYVNAQLVSILVGVNLTLCNGFNLLKFKKYSNPTLIKSRFYNYNEMVLKYFVKLSDVKDYDISTKI